MVITEPWIRNVSPKVKVLFGYRDGHAKLEVIAPIGIVVPVRLSIAQIDLIKRSFDRAYAELMKPEAERKIREDELDPRGKVAYGFPDGHAVISVRIVAKISPWIPLEVSRQEVIDGKPIMTEVHAWSILPQDIREMQSTLVA